MEFRIDYFRCTVHAPRFWVVGVVSSLFSEYVGPFVADDWGRYNYKVCDTALLGAVVYSKPRNGGEYSTVEFPGEACRAIPIERFSEFMGHLEDGVAVVANPTHPVQRWKCTRIDLAWDGVPFAPKDFYEAVKVNEIRSLAKRANLKWFEHPLQVAEDGREGCTGVTFGGRSSERFIRVYDQHGPVRCEFEVKGDRASLVARSFLPAGVGEWPQLAMAHLRDYIDVFRPWWDEFVSGIARAGAKLVDAMSLTLSRVDGWLKKQAGPSLSALYAALGDEYVQTLLEDGKGRASPRLASLVQSLKAARAV